MTTDISLKELIEGGAHFGHQTRRWNPKMAQYIYGVEEDVHVFDLTKTKVLLEEALDFLKKASAEGKNIVLLGTKKQCKEKIIEIGKATGLPFISERWLGGTITNFDQVKRSISKLTEMKEKMAANGYAKYTKKERLMIEREIARLDRYVGGVVNLTAIPEVLFVVDTHKEYGAIREASRAGVTIVGIVDTNADPTIIDYPIPMNDDAAKALEYVLDLVKNAVLEGREKPKKAAKVAKEK